MRSWERHDTLPEQQRPAFAAPVTAAALGVAMLLVALAGVVGHAGLSRPAWADVDVGPGPLTRRASLSSDGHEANHFSREASLSADGRFVAFTSWADNLVPGDGNATADVFVREIASGRTERVSIAADGSEGDGPSTAPTLSADGRLVAFESAATNLVPGDQNSRLDVFVYDRDAGRVERISVASGGTEGDDHSERPSLSAGGRLVAFDSRATNLVEGDRNGTWDVFVRDRNTGTTRRVSLASGGAEGNGLSEEARLTPDGRLVAFHSLADNLVAGDRNGRADAFVHDRYTGETARVSVASDGTEGNHDTYQATLSADGRLVAFFSRADNLVVGDTNDSCDVFVHERSTGRTARVSSALDGAEGNAHSGYPAISADGRLVVFDSLASNLVPDDGNNAEDVFVHDRIAGRTERVSVAADGMEADGASESGALSADGGWVAFASLASNLVADDGNGREDTYLRLRPGGPPGERTVLALPWLGHGGSFDARRAALVLPWLAASRR